jgi:pimeloyl-ACP methyl ester carboxylesterase
MWSWAPGSMSSTRSVGTPDWRSEFATGGPHVIVRVPPRVSNQHLENLESQVQHGLLAERASSFATVVSYDQRGTGLSDPVALGDLPTLASWAEDLHAVVTAAGLERVVLLAEALSGPVAALYAATHPERTRALILLNTFAAIARPHSDAARRQRTTSSSSHGSGRQHCCRSREPGTASIKPTGPPSSPRSSSTLYPIGLADDDQSSETPDPDSSQDPPPRSWGA